MPGCLCIGGDWWSDHEPKGIIEAIMGHIVRGARARPAFKDIVWAHEGGYYDSLGQWHLDWLRVDELKIARTLIEELPTSREIGFERWEEDYQARLWRVRGEALWMLDERIREMEAELRLGDRWIVRHESKVILAVLMAHVVTGVKGMPAFADFVARHESGESSEQRLWSLDGQKASELEFVRGLLKSMPPRERLGTERWDATDDSLLWQVRDRIVLMLGQRVVELERAERAARGE